MENELEELKELSIAKIKVAYNRSVDLESTHLILWDKAEKNMKIRLILTLLLSIISGSSIFFTISLNSSTGFKLFILVADILALFAMGLIICEMFFIFTGRSRDHGHIVNDALQLREESTNFLQYKLDNLDKQGYIDELKSLEIVDKILKDKSAKYTKKLSNKTNEAITQKIEELEKQGTKKYFMTQEEIDSATEKLQKYTALRTCEAWIKFQ
ncbi:MAG: hypothetical protein ACXAEX_07165 [Promethearchaeota archaeon]|jgi:hypothetical protein